MVSNVNNFQPISWTKLDKAIQTQAANQLQAVSDINYELAANSFHQDTNTTNPKDFIIGLIFDSYA